MERVAGSSAGSKRRFKLPKWARYEMVDLEHKLAEERILTERLRSDGRSLLAQRDEAKQGLRLLTEEERIDVVIQAPKQAPLTKYYAAAHCEIFPVFAVQPGDKILIVRRKR